MRGDAPPVPGRALDAEELQALELQLRLAIRWCSRRIPPRPWPGEPLDGSPPGALARLLRGDPPVETRRFIDAVLRSPELRPPPFPEEPALALEAVRRARETRLDPAGLGAVFLPGQRGDLAGGRLLIYRPFDTLVEGATPEESCGFFDQHDAPPWDTWVAWIEPDCVLTWVPAPFVELAQGGIDVNSSDCVAWLDEQDLPITRQLRERGWLR